MGAGHQHTLSPATEPPVAVDPGDVTGTILCADCMSIFQRETPPPMRWPLLPPGPLECRSVSKWSD